jgi:hypothetical protein
MPSGFFWLKARSAIPTIPRGWLIAAFTGKPLLAPVRPLYSDPAEDPGFADFPGDAYGPDRAAMADQDAKAPRILHFRFTLPSASEQMIAMIKSATPLYRMFGEAKVRLLQNVDDPSRFLQEIEYQAPEAMEMNRQQIAGDPRVQAYLQAWRAMFPGAIEIDVFKEL